MVCTSVDLLVMAYACYLILMGAAFGSCLLVKASIEFSQNYKTSLQLKAFVPSDPSSSRPFISLVKRRSIHSLFLSMFSSVYTSISREQKVVFLVLLYAIVKCAPITEQSGKIQKKFTMLENPSKESHFMLSCETFLQVFNGLKEEEVGIPQEIDHQSKSRHWKMQCVNYCEIVKLFRFSWSQS